MRKEFFNDRAQNWACPCDQKSGLIKEKILPFLELKKGENLLDACSGTGALMPLLKEFGLNITEYDYSEKMIDKAKEAYAGLAEFVVGDIENMPFKNESFDKAVCHNALPHIEDKQKAFKEMYRVLKEKGILVISHDASRKAADEHHKKCHKAVSGDMMPSNKDITLLAASAGFDSIEIVDEEDCFIVVCKK